MTDLYGVDVVLDGVHGSLKGRYTLTLKTLLLATLALTATWLLLSGLGVVMDEAVHVDAGTTLLLAGLALAPFVIFAVGRYVQLHGFGAWLIAGLGSFLLAVVLYFAIMILFLTQVLGLR